MLCSRILLEAGSESVKKAWLPRIASGERVFALALTEAQYGWSPESLRTRASKEGKDFLLTGTKVFVHDALHATDLLVAARTGASEVSLFRVDAKAQGVAIRTLEGFVAGLCEVTLEGARASAADVVGDSASGWAALERAALAVTPVLCAYKVGG